MGAITTAAPPGTKRFPQDYNKLNASDNIVILSSDGQNTGYIELTDVINLIDITGSSGDPDVVNTATQTVINDEIGRATNAEQAIQTQVTAEVSRAKIAENTNSSAINSEVVRAKNAELSNTTSISVETSRAIDSENNLNNQINTVATSVSTEKNRAITVEASLTESITTITSNQQADETTLTNLGLQLTNLNFILNNTTNSVSVLSGNVITLTSNQQADEKTLASYGLQLTTLTAGLAAIPPIDNVAIIKNNAGQATLQLSGKTYASAASGAINQGNILINELGGSTYLGQGKFTAPTGAIGMGNPVIDTAAWQAGMAYCADFPGTVFETPKQAPLNLAPPNLTGLLIPPNTAIRAGIGGMINWSPTNTNNLLTAGVINNSKLVAASTSQRSSNLQFFDVAITGTGQTAPNTHGGGGYPFLLQYVDGITSIAMKLYWATGISFHAEYCTDVFIDRPFVRFSARDSLAVWKTTGIHIRGFDIAHGNDDGISLHSDATDPNGPRERILVEDGCFLDVYGVSSLGAKNLVCQNIIFDFVKSRCFYLNCSNAGSRRSSQGDNATRNITISNCQVKNGYKLNRFALPAAASGGFRFLQISADCSQSGDPSLSPSGLTGVPGFAASAGGPANNGIGSLNAINGVIDTDPYNRIQCGDTSLPIGPSEMVKVMGCTVERTVPNCDGSVINPQTGLPFSVVSDLDQRLPQGFFYDTLNAQGNPIASAFYNGIMTKGRFSWMGNYCTSRLSS